MIQTFTLYVEIAERDLIKLQAGDFQLCLTKNIKYNGVEKPGNVIFSSTSSHDLGRGIKLTWAEPEVYQVYMTEKFRVNIFFTETTSIY